MSEKGKGTSRGRATSHRSSQPGPKQILPHSQASLSEQAARRPGQPIVQAVPSVNNIFYILYV